MPDDPASVAAEEALSGHAAHEVDRLTRGRPLTDAEIACYLADNQTPLRHATARVGDEIAEQLRDRLAARSRPAGELDVERLAEALHVVRNHAFDGTSSMHPNDHQLGSSLRQEAHEIAAEYDRLALADAIEPERPA